MANGHFHLMRSANGCNLIGLAGTYVFALHHFPCFLSDDATDCYELLGVGSEEPRAHRADSGKQQPNSRSSTPILTNQHDERYAQAEECMKVMYKLFQSSWRDDGLKLDRDRGLYSDPELLRQIDHKGKYFQVPGPHIVHPSPQRTPLLLQAGASRAGKLFAAQHAEGIFTWAHTPAASAKNIGEIRQAAKDEFGRDPKSLKVLALVTLILGRTEEEAKAKYDEAKKYASLEGALALFGGWTGMDLDQYGDEEELREVESNAVKYVVPSLPTRAEAKTRPGPRWRATLGTRPRTQSGRSRPSPRTSAWAATGPYSWGRLPRWPTAWRVGPSRPMSTASTL